MGFADYIATERAAIIDPADQDHWRGVLTEYQQAKAFTEAFLRGQPHKAKTIASIAKDKLNQLFS